MLLHEGRGTFGECVLRARLELGARQSPPRQISQIEIRKALGVTPPARGEGGWP